jgi:FAD/FMN-containing dehydrogenase
MIPFHAPSCALNRFTVRAFNAWWFHRHPVAPRARQMHIDKFFFPLDGVANWNRMYGRRGFLQYQLVVPPDPERRAIRKLLETITNSGMASFLAVIKEFGQDGQGMLSFARPGTTLALDFTNHGERLLELLKQLDRIVLDAGGAVNLSKDARLSAADFREMYPRFSEWRAVRDKWDPCGLFASSMSRRLGLI